MTTDPHDIDPELILAIARGAVAERFGATKMVIPSHPWLAEPAATFVTINRGEQLRGCIGSIEPRQSLLEDLRHNAVMAAFRDPRFRPLRPDELELVRFSVSILGPRSPVSFRDEADARRQLRPRTDGLLLTFEGHRGVFLPQVWDSLPEPGAFLDNLKRKAGLPADFWSPRLKLERFEVLKFEEPRTRSQQSAQGWHH
jgi:AmmeMemoRadiSam system protein A